jgi:tetrahydromethanopterin S-methyltransferase subunit F
MAGAFLRTQGVWMSSDRAIGLAIGCVVLLILVVVLLRLV